MKKLITFYFSYFTGKCHFEEDGTQHHLILQPISRYFKMIANTKHISSWKSKGLSNESIKPPITSDNNLIPLTDYLGDKIRLKLGGSCLKQPKVTFIYFILVQTLGNINLLFFRMKYLRHKQNSMQQILNVCFLDETFC